MPGIVGLTGGIGCGKSTVAEAFIQLGIHSVDADTVARELSQPGTPQYAAIIEAFGPGIVQPDNQLDRKKLGELVFQDKGKRKILEDILHPPIWERMVFLSESVESPYCVFEIPLLIETGQYRNVDQVLVVVCDVSTRIERLKKYRHMDSKAIRNILDAQMDDDSRAKYADDVITNNSGKEHLYQQVQELDLKYRIIFKR